jgi:cobalt-zinc-cadmium efflux system protein
LEARKALSTALAISVGILVVELFGGIIFESSALVADALHVVADILAILFSLVALNISARPPTSRLTYGYHRIEVVASLVNGLSLFAIVGIIAFQAYSRFLSPKPIGIFGTISLAVIAFILNVASSSILRRVQANIYGDPDLNVSSVGVHLLGDALASTAVIVGAVAVYFTGVKIIDPLAAVFIGLLVLQGAVRITWQGGAILLERSPVKDMQELRSGLGNVTGVADIHDFHVWRICSHITIATMHACLNSIGKKNPEDVRNQLEGRLNRLGMQHVTIQLEESCCIPSHEHS